MATLEQARTFGGIGSILMLLTIVPWAGYVLGIIGFILVLIAVKYISDHTGNRSIFNNYLIAVIVSIVAVVVGAVMGFMGVLGGLGLMGMGAPMAGLIEMLLSLIAALVIIWILEIVAAIFIRRSFNAIASTLNVRMFSTAALLYFIGAILIIAFGIGAIITLVAVILQIIAFFQISVEKAPPPPPPPPP